MWRYHSTTGWKLLAILSADTVIYSDTGLSASNLYMYTVRAYNSAGNSSWSNMPSATTLPDGDTTPPSVPQNLSATANSCSQTSLTWSASTDAGGSGLKGYNLYRGGSYIKQVLAPATSTTDTGLSESATYSYTARAVDNAGNMSASSNTAITNTPACQVCGDGTLDPGEECDDGNTTNGDGCSSVCLIESPDSEGSTVWAEGFGGTDSDIGKTAVVDNFGNVLVAGLFSGTVDFGGGPLTGMANDIFLAKYASDGTHIWSKRFGSTGDDRVQGIAVDDVGNIIVTGHFQETVNFGGGALTSAYDQVFNLYSFDIFLAKYSPDGTHIWSKRFGNAGEDIGYGVAAESNGDVLLTGAFSGWVDFGGGYLQGSNGGRNTVVAKFSGSSGEHIWSKNFLSISDDAGYGIGIDNSDNILVAGEFSGTVDFGDGQVDSAGMSDIFVVKFLPDGSYVWSKQVGGTGNDVANDAAVDSAGNIVVTGFFSNTVNFGGGALTSSGPWDIFVAKYSSSGAHVWSKKLGGTSIDEAYDVAIDGNNNVVVTGSFVSTADFGDGPLTSAGSYDIFVAKYAGANGAHIWSSRFGGSGIEEGYGIAVNGSSDVFVTGFFPGTVDFGSGPLTSNGLYDIFLLQLAP